jgi:hypothetical protein
MVYLGSADGDRRPHLRQTMEGTDDRNKLLSYCVGTPGVAQGHCLVPERPANLYSRVKLNVSEFCTHYAIAILLLAPSVAAVYSLGTHHYVSSAIPGMRILCACTILASAFFASVQTWALRFRVFKTSGSARANYQKVIHAIGKTNWHISQRRAESRIVAAAPGAVTWGERVEVRFHGRDVYVNSICDPSKWPALVAFGDNMRHIAYVRDAVTRIEPSNEAMSGGSSLDDDAPQTRLTDSSGVTAVTKQDINYEPVFGGIVFCLWAALLCFLLFAPAGRSASHIGAAFLTMICAMGMSWGGAQIVGYRKMSRSPYGASKQSPLLGTALGCVFLGLLFIPVTLLLYEFASDHPGYMIVAGGVAILLLSIGAIIGIRQGIWR